MKTVKIKILHSKNSLNAIKEKLDEKIINQNLDNIKILDNEDAADQFLEEEEQQEEQQEEIPTSIENIQNYTKKIYIFPAYPDIQTWSPSSSDVKCIKITLQAGGGGGGVGFISKDTPLFKSGSNIIHSSSPDTFDIGISGTGGSSGESFSKMMNINYDATLAYSFKVGFGGSGATFDRITGIKTDATSGEPTWFKLNGSTQFYETKGGNAASPINIYDTTPLPWISVPQDNNSNSKIGKHGIVFPLDMESYLTALIDKSFTYTSTTSTNSIINDLTWTLGGNYTSSTDFYTHDPSEAYFIKTDNSAIVYNTGGLKQLIEDYINFTTDPDPMSTTISSSLKTGMSLEKNDLFNYFSNLKGNYSSLANVNTGGQYIGGGSGGGGGAGAGGTGYTLDQNLIHNKIAKEGQSGKSGGGGGGGGVDIIEYSIESTQEEGIYYSTNGGNGGDGYIIIEEFLVVI